MKRETECYGSLTITGSEEELDPLFKYKLTRAEVEYKFN